MNGNNRPTSTTDQWMYSPANTRNRLTAKLRYHAPTFRYSIIGVFRMTTYSTRLPSNVILQSVRSSVGVCYQSIFHYIKEE
jgi:hypothetical protein